MKTAFNYLIVLGLLLVTQIACRTVEELAPDPDGKRAGRVSEAAVDAASGLSREEIAARALQRYMDALKESEKWR